MNKTSAEGQGPHHAAEDSLTMPNDLKEKVDIQFENRNDVQHKTSGNTLDNATWIDDRITFPERIGSREFGVSDDGAVNNSECTASACQPCPDGKGNTVTVSDDPACFVSMDKKVFHAPFVHLQMKTRSEVSDEDDDDIAWYFQQDVSLSKPDPDVKSIATVKPAGMDYDLDDDVQITSIKKSSDSDSDFDDCFDDIPSVAKSDTFTNSRISQTSNDLGLEARKTPVSSECGLMLKRESGSDSDDDFIHNMPNYIANSKTSTLANSKMHSKSQKSQSQGSDLDKLEESRKTVNAQSSLGDGTNKMQQSVEKLLKEKLQQSKGNASQFILNRSRHFKTVASTVEELNCKTDRDTTLELDEHKPGKDFFSASERSVDTMGMRDIVQKMDDLKSSDSETHSAETCEMTPQNLLEFGSMPEKEMEGFHGSRKKSRVDDELKSDFSDILNEKLKKSMRGMVNKGLVNSRHFRTFENCNFDEDSKGVESSCTKNMCETRHTDITSRVLGARKTEMDVEENYVDPFGLQNCKKTEFKAEDDLVNDNKGQRGSVPLEDAIRGLCRGNMEVAAVVLDAVQSQLDEGRIKDGCEAVV